MRSLWAILMPESLGLGLDQFGEFMLVVHVPEPPALLLLGAAWLTVTLVRARGRRRRASPSRAARA